MAYTLSQKHNILNKLTIGNSVSFYDRCLMGIKSVGQDYFAGDYTLSDSTLTPYGLTSATMTEWAARALTGRMDLYMMPMIVSYNSLPADPETATDAQIITAVKRSIGPFGVKIQTGAI